MKSPHFKCAYLFVLSLLPMISLVPFNITSLYHNLRDYFKTPISFRQKMGWSLK